MNESMESLLRDLAEKLGVTTEYLWGALLKQAPISAMTSILSVLVLLVAFVWAFRALKRRSALRDVDKDVRFWMWAAWCVTFGIYLLITIGHIGLIVAGLINPEYWALKQVLPG